MLRSLRRHLELRRSAPDRLLAHAWITRLLVDAATASPADAARRATDATTTMRERRSRDSLRGMGDLLREWTKPAYPARWVAAAHSRPRVDACQAPEAAHSASTL